MDTEPYGTARQCEVAPEPLIKGRYDYADSFELVLDQADQHTAPEWLRVALDSASPKVMSLVEFVHGRVAGFRLGPADAAHLRGWRITHADDDVVRLEASGPLLRAAIVARRASATRLTFTTFLFYGHAATRWLWAGIRPVHQRAARYLLETAAAAMASRDGSPALLVGTVANRAVGDRRRDDGEHREQHPVGGAG